MKSELKELAEAVSKSRFDRLTVGESIVDTLALDSLLARIDAMPDDEEPAHPSSIEGTLARGPNMGLAVVRDRQRVIAETAARELWAALDAATHVSVAVKGDVNTKRALARHRAAYGKAGT